MQQVVSHLNFYKHFHEALNPNGSLCAVEIHLLSIWRSTIEATFVSRTETLVLKECRGQKRFYKKLNKILRRSVKEPTLHYIPPKTGKIWICKS